MSPSTGAQLQRPACAWFSGLASSMLKMATRAASSRSRLPPGPCDAESMADSASSAPTSRMESWLPRCCSVMCPIARTASRATAGSNALRSSVSRMRQKYSRPPSLRMSDCPRAPSARLDSVVMHISSSSLSTPACPAPHAPQQQSVSNPLPPWGQVDWRRGDPTCSRRTQPVTAWQASTSSRMPLLCAAMRPRVATAGRVAGAVGNRGLCSPDMVTRTSSLGARQRRSSSAPSSESARWNMIHTTRATAGCSQPPGRNAGASVSTSCPTPPASHSVICRARRHGVSGAGAAGVQVI
mmetsp:Transcript_3207/g.8056  ORF Transcript_3207/g.8056 Transcript_3207/m.8056 type:complete len:297 (+) Transcript_3207:566-1456(+)